MSIRWTEEEFNAWLAKKTNSNSPVRPANVEPDSKHEPTTANVDEAIHPRFHIHVHSRRRRLADPDGICAKFAIDGLVRGGLLPDDSAKEIESVTFSQSLAKREETIIEIEEIVGGQSAGWP